MDRRKTGSERFWMNEHNEAGRHIRAGAGPVQREKRSAAGLNKGYRGVGRIIRPRLCRYTGFKLSLFNILLGLSVLFLTMAVPGQGAYAQKNSTTSPESAISSGFKLTSEEKEWLARHPVIRVAGPKAYPPFHFYDERGKASGIGADYIHLIAEKLGLELEYSPAVPWPEVLENVREHKIDLISCAAKSAERGAYLSFSKPYLSYPIMIITQKDAPFVGGFEDLNGKKIALIKDVTTYDWLTRDGVVFTPHFVDNPLDAYQAVSLGQAFAVIDNLAAASYLIQKNGLSNLKIAAPTDWGSYQLYFAVRKDWRQFTSILDKVLVSLNAAELTSIRNQWISVRYEHGLRPWDVLRWIMVFLVPALVLVLLFFLHNRRLRREVKAREKEVTQRKEAEAELKRIVDQLETALVNIKQLKGLLPICSNCKKIRDDKGYWSQVEEYITQHSEAEFSHSICPDCMKELYPELANNILNKINKTEC